MNSRLLLVYVTFPKKAVAVQLSKALLDKKLIACANIIGKIDSIYNWKGKTNFEKEIVVIFKTTASKYKKLENAIKNSHPYECPCIVALPATQVALKYFKWVQNSL